MQKTPQHTLQWLHSAAVTLLVITFSACAHSNKRGSVATKLHDSEAHVVLGSREVKKGDQVSFYENRCSRPLGGVHQGVHNDPVCRRQKLGTGEVVEVLNETYSMVRTQPEVRLSEGMTVEKD